MSRFYAPAILSHLVSLVVVVMGAVCVPQEKSVEDKIMGHSHRSSSNVGLWIYQIPIHLIIIISFLKNSKYAGIDALNLMKYKKCLGKLIDLS